MAGDTFSQKERATVRAAGAAESGADLHPSAQNPYGMPAHAKASGNVEVFSHAGAKFNARCATLGFQQYARVDERCELKHALLQRLHLCNLCPTA